jgi:hypothetical protein
MIIDLFGLTESEVFKQYPKSYQWVYERVKPQRDQNNRKSYRENWWIFGEPRSNFRPAIRDLKRYIATVETAKHRVFVFVEPTIVSDNTIIAVALEDAYFLGTLSSHIHTIWALAVGGDLGGNTPRYNKTRCFDPFPFPDPTPEQKQKIRGLGERLDVHRKRVQAQHPDVTITGMYNLLEKMRTGAPFTDKDREYNDKALVSTLKQIHDELDAAVFEAYGWSDPPQPPLKRGEKNSSESSNSMGESNQSEPPFSRGAGGISDDEILERLVALNADRAEEERNGLIRWLRPEYQAPKEVAVQQVIEGVTPEQEVVIAPVEKQTWPKKFKEQLAATRDLLRSSGSEWTLEQIAAQFKGATRSKKAIAECLESLEELGILASHDEEGVTRWYFAELQKAS